MPVERTPPLVWAKERRFHQNCPLPNWRKDDFKFLSQHSKLNVGFVKCNLNAYLSRQYSRTSIKLCHTWILVVCGSQNTRSNHILNFKLLRLMGYLRLHQFKKKNTKKYSRLSLYLVLPQFQIIRCFEHFTRIKKCNWFSVRNWYYESFYDKC